MSFYDATELENWYRSAEQELRDAFNTAHSRSSFSRVDRYLLSAAVADRMLAVNMYCRKMVARNLCVGIGERLCINEYWEHDRPTFFLTIIPKVGIVSTNLRGFDPRSISNRLKIVLRGQDYLGVIEPGYFASLPKRDGTSETQAISWHVHALLWNQTNASVATLIERLGNIEAYGAIAPELPAVDARQINNGELPTVVTYLLKPPSKAKRIQRYPWIKDGEIVRYLDGATKFFVKQRSSDLQKSERLRIFHAMKHLTFDQLIVGGGEGKLIRKNALDDFERRVSRRMTA